VLAVGLVASLLGAVQWRSYIGDQQARQVQTTTATAKASLAGAIQRDEDLVETMRGIVASGDPATNVELQRLYENVAATNDAGMVGLAYVEKVPAARLSGFQAEVAADPPLGLPVAGDVATSEGRRPYYCLIRAAVASANGAANLSKAGLLEIYQELTGQSDYCTNENAAALGFAASSGQTAINLLPEKLTRNDSPVRNHLFDVIIPIYSPGAPTRTASERAAALLGWADGLFSPLPVLGPVVARTSGLSISLYYRDPGRAFRVAMSGPSLNGADRRVVSLSADHRWSGVISVVPTNTSATVQGLGVLADLLVIVLLICLIVSLSRSRKKAFESIEHKNAELHHRALHDTLTGLPNRELVLDIATSMLERAEHDDAPVAAFLIDLDGFNAVNDTYGHRVGDAVLEAVAERLLGAIGPADSLGRLAGDEFVIVAVGPSLERGVEVLAECLLTELSAPFELSSGVGEGAYVRITGCIGVAIGHGRSAEDLLRDADTALNEAKGAGRRRFTVFEPAMHTAARSRLAMTGELRTAIEEDQFFLAYQPVFRLADTCPTSVEALLRWRHPVRGVVPPLEFIPVLEETGMIAEVGREVLRLACQQAKQWELRGLPIGISVNASAIQLESEQFSRDVDEALRASGLEPDRLTIEITESALMRDAHGTVRRLGNLKALGISLAIDDFGTGYSSLAYLRQFPVDILKIDQSFVAAMTTSAGGMALVRTMLELARALGLDTVAEGIEDRSELRALEIEHCRHGQGFLLARPLDPEQIELFFDNARPRAIEATVRA